MWEQQTTLTAGLWGRIPALAQQATGQHHLQGAGLIVERDLFGTFAHKRHIYAIVNPAHPPCFGTNKLSEAHPRHTGSPSTRLALGGRQLDPIAFRWQRAFFRAQASQPKGAPDPPCLRPTV